MGYLKRLVLVNSAGYGFAEVRLDGHCDMAGGQGVGKTTLLNAIVYPFVVEDRYIDIDRKEKQIFSSYYFPKANSFVIYEVVNGKDVPYCIVIHKTGASLNFHFVSAPYDEGWLYEGERQVRTWSEIKSKLDAEGISVRHEDTAKQFNNIFLGRGGAYMEQYSIIRSPENKDSIRPLISAIFKNLPFTQETLKEALVASVMMDNQVTSEGIDLASHRRNLSDFVEHLSDMRKMTRRDKRGMTEVDYVARGIFTEVDRYYGAKDALRLIPGRLAYSLSSSRKRLAELADSISSNSEKLSSMKSSWKKRRDELDSIYTDAQIERGKLENELSTILSKKEEYKDVNIADILDWTRNRTTYREELKALEKTLRDIQGDDRTALEEKKAAAIENNRLFYLSKANSLETVYNGRISELNGLISSVEAEVQRRKDEIDEKYSPIIGSDWRTQEMILVDALVDASKKLSCAETIEEADRALSDLEAYPSIAAVLSDILVRRNGTALSVENIRKEVDAALSRLSDELDRKSGLENDMARELAELQEWKTAQVASIESRKDAEKKRRDHKMTELIGEKESKAKQLEEDYDVQIGGNDPLLEEKIKDIKDRIAGVNYVLDTIDKYPSVVSDKKHYFDRETPLREEILSLSKRVEEFSESRKKETSLTEEAISALESRLSYDQREKEKLSTGVAAAEQFIERRSSLKAAMEDADPIENTSSPSSLTQEYSDLWEEIRRGEETIPSAVSKLYSDGLLSRSDTFQLGIGRNDSLSRIEDFLSVADKLRLRLSGGEGESGIDNFIHLYTDAWLTELKDISTVMNPVEKMLSQIAKLCSRATAFLSENNRTDCIDSFKMEVNEKDTTDLVLLLKKINRFYQENNIVLGFDSLFSGDSDPVNKEAISLLEKLYDLLKQSGDNNILMSSMFEIRMDIREKGHLIKNLLSFNNPGSRGTAIVLKAMLNMTLLHLVLEKKQSGNTRLICAIDEMNTIEASNLEALSYFASKAGMFIFGSGQHHTQSVLDYSYNVWDERNPDGSVSKHVDMTAERIEVPVSSDSPEADKAVAEDAANGEM